jgi:Phytochelatin synthase
MSWFLWLWMGLVAAPPALVPFASQEGMARLARSGARADFPHLANEFESQENKAFCGVASAVVVLNALRDRDDRYPKPEDPRLSPAGMSPSFDPLFHRFTQSDFFTPGTDAIKRKDEILGAPRTPGAPRSGGLQLRQLAQLLSAHGLSVEIRVADDRLDPSIIRREIVRNLSTEGDYVVVNYARAGVGQPGGGHISPLGAYDAVSDSFLVLDVNPNHQPWTWVPASALIQAMETKDVTENRGYLLIAEGPLAPSTH